MEKVLHNSPTTQAIRQRMEEVRCDLDEDVQEIVEGARDMGAWRSYVKSYPWVCLGAALAVGYLIVPRRPAGTQAQAQSAESANPIHSPAASPWLSTGGWGGTLLGLGSNLVMRSISSYVLQQADRLFAKAVATPPQDEQP